MAIIINDSNYEEIVNGSTIPVLIDFYADWCGPCKMAAPIVEQISNEQDGKAKICKCNIDENPMLADKFGVQSIPTFIAIKDSKETNRMTGFRGKDSILELLG